jgi:hypothetical protein
MGHNAMPQHHRLSDLSEHGVTEVTTEAFDSKIIVNGEQD